MMTKAMREAVAMLANKGLSAGRIAARLGLSCVTVKHVLVKHAARYAAAGDSPEPAADKKVVP